MRRVLLVATVAACAGEPGDPGIPDEVPYVLDDEDVPSPTASLDDVTASVQGALDAVLALHATPVLAAYRSAVVERDEACPPVWTEVGASSQWYGDCTTSGGARFSGYGYYEEADGVSYEGSDAVEWYRYLYTSSSIRTADGHLFSGGGGAVLGGGETEASRYGSSQVVGSFAWDGPEAAGTWLAEGTELDLGMYWTQEAWGQAVSLQGAVVEPGGDAVHFDGVVLVDAACVGEPGGTISVRGPDGWYDVIFDLDVEALDQVDPQRCDGCGAAWYRGAEVGTVCVDADDLARFSDDPW